MQYEDNNYIKLVDADLVFDGMWCVWCVVRGVWCVVRGRCVVCGVWCVVWRVVNSLFKSLIGLVERRPSGKGFKLLMLTNKQPSEQLLTKYHANATLLLSSPTRNSVVLEIRGGEHGQLRRGHN